MYNTIRSLLEGELKIPQDPPVPIVNLGLGIQIIIFNSCLGEPSKANGFDLPEVISEAVIEAVKSEKHNSYTASSGMLEAR